MLIGCLRRRGGCFDPSRRDVFIGKEAWKLQKVSSGYWVISRYEATLTSIPITSSAICTGRPTHVLTNLSRLYVHQNSRRLKSLLQPRIPSSPTPFGTTSSVNNPKS